MAGSFGNIFKTKSKEEFAKNPISLTGYMIDQRFPKEDVTAYRTMARICPAVVAKLLRGSIGPEEATALAVKQAKVDASTAGSLFDRMCGKEVEVEAPSKPREEPKPVPKKERSVPIKDEPVPPGLILNVDGSGATVLKYMGNARDLRIPGSYKGHPVTSIAEKAFEKCEKLASVDIADSVETIGNEAFSNCKMLESVRLPDSLRTLGKNAFFFCRALKKVEIPDSTETIGELAFNFCESMISAKIPASVRSIASDAFRCC